MRIAFLSPSSQPRRCAPPRATRGARCRGLRGLRPPPSSNRQTNTTRAPNAENNSFTKHLQSRRCFVFLFAFSLDRVARIQNPQNIGRGRPVRDYYWNPPQNDSGQIRVTEPGFFALSGNIEITQSIMMRLRNEGSERKIAILMLKLRHLNRHQT